MQCIAKWLCVVGVLFLWACCTAGVQADTGRYQKVSPDAATQLELSKVSGNSLSYQSIASGQQSWVFSQPWGYVTYTLQVARAGPYFVQLKYAAESNGMAYLVATDGRRWLSATTTLPAINAAAMATPTTLDLPQGPITLYIVAGQDTRFSLAGISILPTNMAVELSRMTSAVSPDQCVASMKASKIPALRPCDNDHGEGILSFQRVTASASRIAITTNSQLCLTLSYDRKKGQRGLRWQTCSNDPGFVNQQWILQPTDDGRYFVVGGGGATCLAVDQLDGMPRLSTAMCNAVADTQLFFVPGITTAAYDNSATDTKKPEQQAAPSQVDVVPAAEPEAVPPTTSAPDATSLIPVEPARVDPPGNAGCLNSASLSGRASSEHPSGQAPPTCSPPNFSLYVVDDFNGNWWDQNRWQSFQGLPSGSKSYWTGNLANNAQGMLNLATNYQPATNSWVSAGIGMVGVPITYGKILLRFRADYAPGVELDALLWPADNTWPPEIDIYEDDAGTRDTMYAFQHYSDANDNHRQYWHDPVSADFTQWHTMGVEWTPGRLVYTIDGRVWASNENADVPNIPMWLGVQTEVFQIKDNTPHASMYQLDWVAVYRYTPGSVVKYE
jgi:hypothetical protein